MSAIDRLEDRLEREHPRLYVALAMGLLLALFVIGVLWLAVADRPAT